MTRNQFIVGMAKAILDKTENFKHQLDGFLVVESRDRIGIWGPLEHSNSTGMMCISVWGNGRCNGMKDEADTITLNKDDLLAIGARKLGDVIRAMAENIPQEYAIEAIAV